MNLLILIYSGFKLITISPLLLVLFSTETKNRATKSEYWTTQTRRNHNGAQYLLHV